MNKKRGLGKGLGALLPDSLEDTIVEKSKSYNRVKLIDINQIKANKSQPRFNFDQSKLNSLSDSIRDHGVLQPIIIRDVEEGYEIVAGERRWRASMNVGLSEIPAIVMDENEEKLYEISLIENLQRENLNPIEEAMAYQTLMNSYEFTQDKVSQVVGKSRPHIANTLRLINLTDEVREHIISNKLSAGHGRCLVTLPDSEQVFNAKLAIDKEMSVRELEKHISRSRVEKKTTMKKDIFIKEFENKLSEALGTKVEIDNGKRKGKIKIEFYTESDLERLFYLINKE